MKYKEKKDRSQISFLPECVEDHIDAENPARVIDAFVDSLDMETLGFLKAKAKAANVPFGASVRNGEVVPGGALPALQGKGESRSGAGPEFPCLQHDVSHQHGGNQGPD